MSTSYLATGIFLVPLIAGREPRGQAALTRMWLVPHLVLTLFPLRQQRGHGLQLRHILEAVILLGVLTIGHTTGGCENINPRYEQL